MVYTDHQRHLQRCRYDRGREGERGGRQLVAADRGGSGG